MPSQTANSPTKRKLLRLTKLLLGKIARPHQIAYEGASVQGESPTYEVENTNTTGRESGRVREHQVNQAEPEAGLEAKAEPVKPIRSPEEEAKEALAKYLPSPSDKRVDLNTLYKGMLNKTTEAFQSWQKLTLSSKDITWLEDHLAIHAAVKLGNIMMLKYLLQLKLNPNKSDDEGNTALHYAVKEKGLAMVRLLLEANAESNVANNKNETPANLAETSIRSAGFYEKFKLQEILRMVSPERTIAKGMQLYEEISEKLRNGNADGIPKILNQAKEYFQEDSIDFDGLSHLAVLNNTIKALPHLHNADLSLEIADEDSNTPLIKAVALQNKAAVEQLIKLGVAVNAFGQYGFTAVHFAAQRLNGAMIEILLNSGADASLETFNVATASQENTARGLAMKELPFCTNLGKNEKLAMKLLGLETQPQ